MEEQSKPTTAMEILLKEQNSRPRLTPYSMAAFLRVAPRQGADTDEPEGSRYIQISDTLALKFAEVLEEYDRRTR